MIFIRPVLVVFSLSCILSACGVLPAKNEDLTAKSEDTIVSTDDTGADIAELPFEVIPRPSPEKTVAIPSSAREEFSKAKQAIILSKWAEAEGLLILMSETYPQLAGIYTNLGIVYAQLDKYDDAEKAYRFAIDTNAYNFDAYTNLGVLLREQGRFDDAQKVYQDALILWPHHRPSLLNMGVLYDMYIGDLPAALTHFELAQKLSDEEDKQLKGWIIDLQRRMKQ